MMTHNLETNHFGEKRSSLITPRTLGPIGVSNVHPTRLASQQVNPRYHDYALQPNSAGMDTTPHGLTTMPWDSPLLSPPQPQPPWTPSISTGSGSFIPVTLPLYPLDTSTTTPSLFSDYQDNVSKLPDTYKEPGFREQRSRSYTTDYDSTYYNKAGLDSRVYADNNGIYNNVNHLATNRSSSLYTMPEEGMNMVSPPFNTPYFFNASHSHTLPRYQNDGDDDPMAYHRTRSKSSAPAFDIWYPSDTSTTEINTRWLHQLSSNSKSNNNNNNNNQQQHQQTLPLSLYTPFLSTTEGQRLGPTRRFSVQPSSYNQMSFSMKDGTSDRRHSMAGPTLSHDDEPSFIMTSLVDSIDELTKPQPTSTDIEPPTVLPIPSTAAASTTITSTGAKDLYAKVAAAGLTDATTTRPPSQHQDSQVDSTAPSSSSSSLTTTTIAVSAATTTCPYYTLPKSDDMGKGIKMESIPKDASYYVVEFKAGRTDIYFSPLMVKVGDLVMVEADRGHDLGKVVVDAMTPSQLLNYTQQQQQEDLVEQDTKSTLQQRGDLRIKRLFRLARPEEITQLVSKSEDELKALSTCQARVQQRKLNISVVNAEFQMDRRKLIFYFIAEKRVDFRELVRDLFKVYKTRIWMCAVNNNKKR